MRRKPTSGSGGYNNNQQRNKPRYQGGGQGGGEHRSHNSGHHNNGGRPRKNYAANREKYLTQARDALAAGDRVLAENYFQHADHCYRMMVEEGYQVRNNYTPPPQGEQQEGQQQDTHQQGEQASHPHNGHGEEHTAPAEQEESSHQLPAFLTGGFEQPQAEPVVVQSWEE